MMKQFRTTGHSLVEVTFALGILAVILTGASSLYFTTLRCDMETQRRVVAHHAAVSYLEKTLNRSTQEIIDSPGVNKMEYSTVDLPDGTKASVQMKVYDVTPTGGKGVILKIQVVVVVQPNPAPLARVAGYKWDGGGEIPAPPVEPEPEW